MKCYEKAGFQLKDAVKSNFTVRYGETDQMKFMYYGRYFEWFEIGRVDWIKSRGSTYVEMEEDNCFLPVVDMKVRYIAPNQYDDNTILYTWLKAFHKKKIVFYHVIENLRTALITTEAEIMLIPVNSKGKMVSFPPKFFTIFQS